MPLNMFELPPSINTAPYHSPTFAFYPEIDSSLNFIPLERRLFDLLVGNVYETVKTTSTVTNFGQEVTTVVANCRPKKELRPSCPLQGKFLMP